MKFQTLISMERAGGYMNNIGSFLAVFETCQAVEAGVKAGVTAHMLAGRRQDAGGT